MNKRDPARDVALFERISTALAERDDATRALEDALAVIAEAFDIAAAWVWLADADSGRFYVAASRGLPAFLREPVEMTGDPCWCLNAFDDGDFETQNVRTIDCSRLRRAESEGTPELAEGLKYHASVLLRFGSRQLGILNLSRADWRPLSGDDLAVLSALGAQLGLALERARLSFEANAAARTGERTRLAREIHDTLAQDLTGISLQLEGSLRALEREPELARERIELALCAARRSLDDARNAVTMLRSDPLGGRTLGAALAALTRTFASDSGILTAFADETTAPIPYAAECELYRVATEALENVRKHARARRVDVGLHESGAKVELLIDDDGLGIGSGTVPEGHYGIVGMTERMTALGGTLSVGAYERPGTRVRALVPISSPQ